MGKRYTVEEGNLPTVKRCTKCSVEKVRKAFARSSAHKDGLYPWCGECRTAYRKTPVAKASSSRSGKQYRRTHPEMRRFHSKKYGQAWRVNNPEAAHLINRRAKEARRARMANVVNTLTTAEWEEILLTFNHACAYCLQENVPLEQEHMKPLSKGGSHTADNVIPACRACNARKSNKSLLEFVAHQSGASLYAHAA